MVKQALIGVCLALVAIAMPARAAMSPNEMCGIIRHDIRDYLATGHPCPCPYNLTRRGTACGHLSAWAKPNGRSPRCYFQDVDGTMPPNLRPNPTRQHWPDPPPCGDTR